MGAKVCETKKSKSVQLLLKVKKANGRAKNYDHKLYVLNDKKEATLLGEYQLNLEEGTNATNFILQKYPMNNNQVFLLKIRPISYIQVVKDQQDLIEQLKARLNQPLPDNSLKQESAS